MLAGSVADASGALNTMGGIQISQHQPSSAGSSAAITMHDAASPRCCMLIAAWPWEHSPQPRAAVHPQIGRWRLQHPESGNLAARLGNAKFPGGRVIETDRPAPTWGWRSGGAVRGHRRSRGPAPAKSTMSRSCWRQRCRRRPDGGRGERDHRPASAERDHGRGRPEHGGVIGRGAIGPTPASADRRDDRRWLAHRPRTAAAPRATCADQALGEDGGAAPASPPACCRPKPSAYHRPTPPRKGLRRPHAAARPGMTYMTKPQRLQQSGKGSNA